MVPSLVVLKQSKNQFWPISKKSLSKNLPWTASFYKKPAGSLNFFKTWNQWLFYSNFKKDLETRVFSLIFCQKPEPEVIAKNCPTLHKTFEGECQVLAYLHKTVANLSQIKWIEWLYKNWSMLQPVMHIKLSDPTLAILKYPHITQFFLNLVSTIHTILEDWK